MNAKEKRNQFQNFSVLTCVSTAISPLVFVGLSDRLTQLIPFAVNQAAH